MKAKARLLGLAVLLLLLSSCVVVLSSCIAIIVDEDDVADDKGSIGAGGSMSIAIDRHPAFEMAVSDDEVTLVLRGRTIYLPHTRGAKGVRFEDFDYEDGEITVHLGGGVEAEIRGTTVRIDNVRHRLESPGVYRLDEQGFYRVESH